MKLRFSMILLALTCVFQAAYAAKVHAPQGFLSNDLEGAKKLAAEQNKPVYIHFTTEWCGWCRKIESETYPDESVKESMAKFVAVSLDCTDTSSAKVKKWLQLMNKVGGSGYPTLAMITPDGHTLNMVSGYLPPKALKTQLDKALKKYDLLREFNEYSEQADSASLEYNLKAMEFYLEFGQADKAARAARIVLRRDAENKSGKAAQAHLVVILSANADEDNDNIPEGIHSRSQHHFKELVKLLGEDFAADKDKKEIMIKALMGVAETELRSLTPNSPAKKVSDRMDSVLKKIDQLEELIPSSSEQFGQIQLLTANTGLILVKTGDKERGAEIIKKAIAQAPQSRMSQWLKEVAKQMNIDLN